MERKLWPEIWVKKNPDQIWFVTFGVKQIWVNFLEQKLTLLQQ